MNAKTCTICKEEKLCSTEFFYKEKNGKYGFRSKCKICMKKENKENYLNNIESKKEYRDLWYQQNPSYNKSYYKRNCTKLKNYSRKYRSENLEKIKLYRQNNRKTISEYERKRRNESPEVKTVLNLRSRLRAFLAGNNKSQKTQELLGCDQDKLISHLESQFDDSMTWENYGSYWHIDHIIPCNSFDPSLPEDQKRCFNYRNLRPLKGVDNISKGNYLDLDLVEKYNIQNLLPLDIISKACKRKKGS